MWKTFAKQTFDYQNYQNNVLEGNFSKHLNISLENTKRKTLTKHNPLVTFFPFYVSQSPMLLFLPIRFLFVTISQEDHPNPYKLSWLKKGSEVKVTKRCLVSFFIRQKFQDEVVCDVIKGCMSPTTWKALAA